MEKITQNNQAYLLETTPEEFTEWMRNKEMMAERKAFNMLIRFPELYSRGRFFMSAFRWTKAFVRSHLKAHRKELHHKKWMEDLRAIEQRKIEKKEKLVERIEQINLFREQGKTIREIGVIMGVSGTRIGQIARHPINPRQDLCGNIKVRPKEIIACVVCGGERSVVIGKLKKEWAHPKCRIPKTKEQLLARQRELAKIRYQNPDKKRRHSLVVKKYYLKKKSDPVRWEAHKKREREYQRKYLDDMKINNPEKYKERLKKWSESAKKRLKLAT